MDELRTELESVQSQLKELRKARHGKSSEKRKTPKMPPPVSPKSDPQDAADRRRRNAEVRDLSCDEETVEVPADGCGCGKCSSLDLKVIGTKSSVIYEHVREHFRKRTFRRQTVKCRNCGHVATAPAPVRFAHKTRYAPSFVAHLIYMKWSNSMPQYRLEKSYRALGIPMSRSTMCDLVHRAAGELEPLYQRMRELVRQAPDVHADETTIRQQRLDKKAFLWVFVAPDVTVYRYATTRSGSIPYQVLGDSEGRLVVDQYTGYNQVTKLGRRERAGCLAHARRKIFEQSHYPEAEEALDLVARIYQVEADSRQRGDSLEQRRAVRQRESRPVFARLLCWARRHVREHEPRSAMGKAIRYLLKNRRELACFLRHPTIPPDNNPAEAALRRVAVGRGNYLFVGNENTGHNHAVLYSLVATCEKQGVNPLDYLGDVLMRVQDHPASRIDELLPHRWKPPDAAVE